MALAELPARLRLGHPHPAVAVWDEASAPLQFLVCPQWVVAVVSACVCIAAFLVLPLVAAFPEMAATCLAAPVYEVRGAFPRGRRPVDCQKFCLDRRVHLGPVLQVSACTADFHLAPVLADASVGRDADPVVAGFPELYPAPDRGFPCA